MVMISLYAIVIVTVSQSRMHTAIILEPVDTLWKVWSLQTEPYGTRRISQIVPIFRLGHGKMIIRLVMEKLLVIIRVKLSICWAVTIQFMRVKETMLFMVKKEAIDYMEKMAMIP